MQAGKHKTVRFDVSSKYNYKYLFVCCQSQDVGVNSVQMTEYGKAVKKELIEKDKSMKWLVGEIGAKTGLYCDTSYLNKILSGKRNAAKIKAAICDILGVKEAE